MSDQVKPASAFGFVIRILMKFKWLALGIFIFETMQAIATVMMPFAARGIIDALDSFDKSGALSIWDALTEPFTFFIWMALTAIITSRISGVFYIFFEAKIRVPIRLLLFKQLQFQSVDYFSNKLGGSFGNRINEVAEGISSAFLGFMFIMWSSFIVFMATIVTIYWIYPMMALVVGGWMVLYLAFSIYAAIPSSKYSEILSKNRSHISGRIIDVASNIVSMKAFASDKAELANLKQDMQEEVRYTYKFRILREIVNWMHFVFSYVFLAGCIFYAIQLYEQSLISLGSVAFIFTILLSVISQARFVGFQTIEFFNQLGQIREGVTTIMTPVSVKDKSGAPDLQLTKAKIHFDNVSFQYPESEQGAFFDEFDLTITPGQKVGIVGSSGAGKSTLVNLILRFYDLNGGAIKIDGQDIAQVTQNSLREQIAFIPQDTALFHRSLMDNIRYGRPDASDDEVIEAAKKAHIHDYVQTLPEKYDTLVGERGVKLSGGQRQRIAIARAVLKDSPILILDEATSALDSESEHFIQQSLQDLMKEKTVIAIAHRLSTIASLDRLIVMADGAIAEDGNHDTLLKEKGVYAKLWSMQSGGFLSSD